MRTFGVEEELLIVEPAGGRSMPLAHELLSADSAAFRGAVLSAEFKQEHIEVQTRPCSTLGDLLREIRRGRAAADAAARAVGARVVALATSPMPGPTHTMPGPATRQ